MASESNFIWGWIYTDGNIINDDDEGVKYDTKMTRLAKLHINLTYEELLKLLFAKLWADSSIYKLNILHRFMNPTTNRFEVAPVYDDDDVEFIFESCDASSRKNYVELYIEKVPINLPENSSGTVQNSINGEKSSASQSSKKLCPSESVGGSGDVSSGNSNRSFYMTRVDSDGNSIGSREYRDEEIPYYKSFDGKSMVASFHEPIMQKVGDILNAKELEKGMIFETKEELMRIVKDVHIANHQEVKIVRSDSTSWKVECKRKETGCPWMLRVRKRKMHNFFEIMETSGPHTCLNPSISQDHHNLNSSNIAQAISCQVAADPGVSEKILLATTVSQYGYTPTRKKIRSAKEQAIKNVYGSWEQSYRDLPFFMNALQSFNHGTRVEWYFKEHDVEEPIPEVVRFKRVFWTFQPCIDAFPYCIPVIQIDGTHLYGKYGGVLLTATTIDGFNHLLPIAFAIVEGENISSWSWFMERLRKKVVLRRYGVCVISDRHAGIMSAMNNPDLGWIEPQGYHRYCARHLAANFAKEFKKSKLKERIVALCNQLTYAKFTLHWNALLAVEPRAQEWFNDKHPKYWALAFDEGKRFGIMTTNIAESWNNAIKSSRKLPITALVKALFYKVVEYFDQRRIEIEKQCVNGNEFTKHANKILNKWKERASGHHVKVFDRNQWVFEVTTMKHGQKGGNQQIVRLMERICTCNKWQTFHIPCSHVLACCANQNMQHTSLVSNWYKLDNARKVYGGQFEPIPDQSRWPSMESFPMVVHDDEDIVKKKGRRKSTRYKNEMDYNASQKKNKASSSGP